MAEIPLAFIHIGEQFMSNNPSRIRSPHFVLWSSIFKSERRVLKNREVDEAANNLKRLSFFRRFGVHIIFDTELAEICESKDKKKIIVDSFTRWKIIDPLKVFQVAKTRERVESRMQDVVSAKVREVLGQHTLHEIVTGGEGGDKRTGLMVAIRDLAGADAANLGIEIVDVRIKRADLPEQNSESVFRRMKAERQRIAKQYRSEGEEAAKEIRATADKESKFLLADAYKQSEIIKGNADAKSTKIYASSYEQDANFYAFTRSLEAYRKAMASQSRVVLSPSSEFFRYFENSK